MMKCWWKTTGIMAGIMINTLTAWNLIPVASENGVMPEYGESEKGQSVLLPNEEPQLGGNEEPQLGGIKVKDALELLINNQNFIKGEQGVIYTTAGNIPGIREEEKANYLMQLAHVLELFQVFPGGESLADLASGGEDIQKLQESLNSETGYFGEMGNFLKNLSQGFQEFLKKIRNCESPEDMDDKVKFALFYNLLQIYTSFSYDYFTSCLPSSVVELINNCMDSLLPSVADILLGESQISKFNIWLLLVQVSQDWSPVDSLWNEFSEEDSDIRSQFEDFLTKAFSTPTGVDWVAYDNISSVLLSPINNFSTTLFKIFCYTAYGKCDINAILEEKGIKRERGGYEIKSIVSNIDFSVYFNLSQGTNDNTYYTAVLSQEDALQVFKTFKYSKENVRLKNPSPRHQLIGSDNEGDSLAVIVSSYFEEGLLQRMRFEYEILGIPAIIDIREEEGVFTVTIPVVPIPVSEPGYERLSNARFIEFKIEKNKNPGLYNVWGSLGYGESSYTSGPYVLPGGGW